MEREAWILLGGMGAVSSMAALLPVRKPGCSLPALRLTAGRPPVLSGLRLAILQLVLLVVSAGCSFLPGDGGTSQSSPGALLAFSLDYYSPKVSPGIGPIKSSYGLQPIDPATGRLDGRYQPLVVRGIAFPNLAVSPDGRTLAATMGDWDESRRRYFWPLHLFRLDRWEETPPLVLEDPVSSLLWSTDGSRLYVFTGGQTTSRLRVIDVLGAKPRLRAEVDQPFVSEWLKASIAPDGRTLYSLGYVVGAENVTFGAPFIIAIDAETGRERARVELPGVKAGMYQERLEPAGVKFRAYVPGLAMSPDGRRYYVFHADRDAFTVVNLETMEIERTVDLEQTLSLRERISSWWEPVARAKDDIGSGGARNLMVSPDGRWLYAFGTTPRMVPAKGGPFPFRLEDVSTGIQVIDTRTMREVARIAPGEARSASLSPDGRYLYVVGYRRNAGDPEDNGGSVLKGSGLRMVRTGSWKVVRHLTPEALYSQVVASADGRFLYLFDDTPEEASGGEARRGLSVVRTSDWTSRSEEFTEQYPFCVMAGPGPCRPW